MTSVPLAIGRLLEEDLHRAFSLSAFESVTISVRQSLSRSHETRKQLWQVMHRLNFALRGIEWLGLKVRNKGGP